MTNEKNPEEQTEETSSLSSNGLDYAYHRIANTFPVLSEDELTDLAQDIKKHGQQEPIKLFEGKILDGRNRYLACKKAGVEPKFEDWDGTEYEADSFVWSENFHRRHFSSSQKAAFIVERIDKMKVVKEKAKERQIEAGKNFGRGTKNESQQIAEAIEPKETNESASIIATAGPTNRQYIRDAEKIKEKAPSVHEAVKRGSIKIPAAKKVICLKPEKQEEVLAKIKSGEKPNKVIRAAQEQERRELPTPELPEGTYDVIYADPPWKYEFCKSESREIENQYPTMDIAEIKALEVPAAENSILFLWSPAPKLEEALKVMNSWGFSYKTNMVWDKEIIGMGYYFRNQHELLLVGVKGTISPPATDARESSVYKEKRGQHSAKPEWFYTTIEAMYPDGTYLELFARGNTRENWVAWGNELKQEGGGGW